MLLTNVSGQECFTRLGVSVVQRMRGDQVSHTPRRYTCTLHSAATPRVVVRARVCLSVSACPHVCTAAAAGVRLFTHAEARV